jgi:hypothetical protein
MEGADRGMAEGTRAGEKKEGATLKLVNIRRVGHQVSEIRYDTIL